MNKPFTLSIIIPVYNEEESLDRVIPNICNFSKKNGFKVIFINDGSKDKSLMILKDHSEQHEFTLIHNKVNKGYGGAIKEGIKACSTDYLVTVDADGQHDINDILKLRDYLVANEADMVIGKREDNKSNAYRRLGKILIRGVAKMLMTIKITDINSGMKMYDTNMAKKYIKLCPNNMAYSDTIALIFINQRHLVLEHPINLNKRLGGKSTINYKTAFQTVIEVINIVVLFNPLNIFLPLSIFFTLLGLAWAIPFFINQKGLTVFSMLMITIGILLFFLGLISEQLGKLRKSKIE